MKQSFTYYITLWVIKLKGLKMDFSKDPIHYKKIRKGDVADPPNNFFKPKQVRKFKILDSIITEIQTNGQSDKLLIFIPGGAFISGPAQHHWEAAKKIAKETNQTIWMCNYPKAPENKIAKISANIDSIYRTALENYQPEQICFLGDSAGGTLIVSLIQRLVIKQEKLPRKIILVSPVMDASMCNPEIDKVDALDPMLSKKGVLSAKKMCAENNDLKDVQISPIYGSFEKFPPTVLFLAENDITYLDQKLAVRKLKEANIDLEIIEGHNMPHIWPFLPVMKEAGTALKAIIRSLKF